MDLIDALQSLAARLDQQLSHIQTEEATKNALVLPFINALGYNVFDLTAKWNRPGRGHGSGYPRPVVGAGRKNPNVAPSLPSGAGGEGDV